MHRLGLLIVVVTSAQAAEFFVAPGGDDSSAGTREAPFATIDGALNAVSAAPTGEHVTITVAPGIYRVDSTIRLGEAFRNLTIRGQGGGETRLMGGVLVAPEHFAALRDEAVLARLDEVARARVVVADVKALPGMADAELPSFPDHFEAPPVSPELFFNGARMTLARWPNEGWAEVAEVVESGPAPWRNHESDKIGVVKIAGDRPARWATAPAAWLGGYWCFDWAFDTIRVASIDTETGNFTFAVQHHYGFGGGNPGARRFYAINLLEELDAPGEYYLDAASGRLYFWPPETLDGSTVVLSTLTEPVIHIEGASDLRLENVVVEATAEEGIEVHGGANVTIASCTVRNTGHAGIVVNGGTKHRVMDCTIHDTGTAGNGTNLSRSCP